MDIVSTLLGLFLIVCGFLAKAYPNLIAGYNTMPVERKKLVDINGLSSLMRNSFIAMGVLVMALHYVFDALGWESYTWVGMMGIILGISAYLLVKAPRYDAGKGT